MNRALLFFSTFGVLANLAGCVSNNQSGEGSAFNRTRLAYDPGLRVLQRTQPGLFSRASQAQNPTPSSRMASAANPPARWSNGGPGTMSPALARFFPARDAATGTRQVSPTQPTADDYLAARRLKPSRDRGRLPQRSFATERADATELAASQPPHAALVPFLPIALNVPGPPATPSDRFSTAPPQVAAVVVPASPNPIVPNPAVPASTTSHQSPTMDELVALATRRTNDEPKPAPSRTTAASPPTSANGSPTSVIPFDQQPAQPTRPDTHLAKAVPPASTENSSGTRTHQAKNDEKPRDVLAETAPQAVDALPDPDSDPSLAGRPRLSRLPPRHTHSVALKTPSAPSLSPPSLAPPSRVADRSAQPVKPTNDAWVLRTIAGYNISVSRAPSTTSAPDPKPAQPPVPASTASTTGGRPQPKPRFRLFGRLRESLEKLGSAGPVASDCPQGW